MKTSILSLLFVSAIAIAGTAQKLVEEGNQWNIIVLPTFTPNTSTYVIKIGNDTTINNLLYNKVYFAQNEQGLNGVFSGQWLRQDSSKVYLKAGIGDEYVLYDFGLMVNDTFQAYGACEMVVTEIDSVTLNNGDRRKMLKLEMVGFPNGWDAQVWIEGIGTGGGLLSHFEYCATDYAQGLLCFYSGGELMFPQAPPSCFIVGVDEITPNLAKVYPNPVSRMLYIGDSLEGLRSYSIINLLGAVVLQGSLDEDLQAIDVSTLPTGNYTLLLADEKQMRFSKRMVKVE